MKRTRENKQVQIKTRLKDRGVCRVPSEEAATINFKVQKNKKCIVL